MHLGTYYDYHAAFPSDVEREIGSAIEVENVADCDPFFDVQIESDLRSGLYHHRDGDVGEGEARNESDGSREVGGDDCRNILVGPAAGAVSAATLVVDMVAAADVGTSDDAVESDAVVEVGRNSEADIVGFLDSLAREVRLGMEVFYLVSYIVQAVYS